MASQPRVPLAPSYRRVGVEYVSSVFFGRDRRSER